MIVFDTEDDSKELLASGKSGFDKTVTQIAGICDNGKRFHNSGNVREFLKWCHQQRSRDVWAFNTQYDIGNLCNNSDLHKLDKDGGIVSRLIKSDKSIIRMDDFDVTLVKGRFIKGQLEGLNFYDARNLCGGSVKDLGKAVGLEKLEMDVRSSKYVFRDCEIVMRWLKFVREQCVDMGVEKIPATLGGLCVKAFTASGGINWHEASDESSEAIRGARVELFSQGGTGRIAYVDINSLYPHCMTMLFPDSMNRLSDLNGFGICKCSVEVDHSVKLAALPFRDDEGRLLFPIGRFSGVWTIHELQNAIKHAGTKITHVEWIYGSKVGKPFYRDYILENYQRRLAAKSPAESLFFKLLMNNLYGRLAIGGEISRSLNLTEENQHDLDGIPYGRKILSTQKMPLPPFTNYLHAVHVLSYARITLFHYLRQIPLQDLIYCDTDSVIFFCKGNPPFPVSKNLGEMKLESWGSRCEPILPKTYIFDNVYKAKGVPKAHAKQFIETGSAEYESPFKYKESIRFYNAKNSRKLSVWRKVTKDLKSVYDKKREKDGIYLPKILSLP